MINAAIFVIAFLVYLFISARSPRNKQTLENTNTIVDAAKKMELGKRTRIKYQRVTDGPNSPYEHVRFSAFYRKGSSKVDLDDEWKPLSAQNWLELFSSENKNSRNLAIELSEKMKEAAPKYDAFYFETKGISSSNASQKQFEFVLVNAPSLYTFAEGHPDPNAFAQHLNCLPSYTGVCSFPNLSGDATLVSPRKKGSLVDKTFSHLAAFLRGADNIQIAELWKLSANEMLKMLEKFPGKSVWFSTSGTGVAWLHMRLCLKPKYYTYKEFRRDE